jgi:hypothetical protein
MARAWKRENPLPYDAIVAWAHADQQFGCRPSIDLYANLLRHPHFAELLGLKRSDAVYRLNNNLRSELARLVMEEHPDIKFETRKSSADPASGPPA